MNHEHFDPFRELVERVARSIAPPAPPCDLSVRPSLGVRRWQPLATKAVMALVVLAFGGYLVIREPAEQVSMAPAKRVVIERLRIGGRPAASRMSEPVGVGAVLVLADSVDAISGVETGKVQR